MHRPTLPGTQRRTCTWSPGTARTGALKNWLSWNRTSRNRTRTRSRLAWRGWPDRRLIHRTRSGVRNNHSRRRRLRTSRDNWSCRSRCYRSRRLSNGLRNRRTWSRRLRHGRGSSRRTNRTRRNRHRWRHRNRSRRRSDWRRWNRKCRPDSCRWNDNSGCRCCRNWRQRRSHNRRGRHYGW